MELFFILSCFCAVGLLLAGEAASSVDTGEDDELTAFVKAAREGDKRAFDQIVLMFQTRMYNLSLNYVKQAEEAQDLTQDIFVTVYKALSTLHDVNKFSAWLYQIALNHCRNRYKKLQRKGFFNSQSLDDPDMPLHLTTGDNPAQKIENQHMLALLAQEIGKLSAAEREIILLRDVQELAYEEISDILHIPLGTVKSKLNRARNSLKERLKKVL